MAVVKTNDEHIITCLDIEIAVAKHFGYRQHLIVPNVSWGLGLSHECDVLVMTRSGYCTEIEIKTSRADLKRDLLKRHQHQSSKIQRHFLAVPKALMESALEFFQPPWGILCVDAETRWVTQIRVAVKDKSAKALDRADIDHLYELASMRIWTLKQSLSERIDRKRLKEALKCGS